jgi:RNA polymerase-interacting CarD/CdnL/TRCF family regulator
MELAAGDRVVYPNQGVCRVTGIEEQEVAGQRLVFVTMQREEDGARVMVPKPKLQSIGVRKISSPDEVQKIFAFLKADTEKADLDWKQRARVNLDRMSGGGLLGLAEVVKGLQVLSELRPLPTKERELYDDARHLLVSEIAAALGMPECNAEDAVDVALFPPGKERPKRTAEEFKRVGGEDELDLGEDLLEVGGDLELPPDEEPQEQEEEEPEAAEQPAEEEEEEAAPRRVPRSSLKRAEEPEAAAEKQTGGATRKRGRPAKAKAGAVAEEAAAAPKKRGRPAKAKPSGEAASAKKRTRPRKSALSGATRKRK